MKPREILREYLRHWRAAPIAIGILIWVRCVVFAFGDPTLTATQVLLKALFL